MVRQVSETPDWIAYSAWELVPFGIALATVLVAGGVTLVGKYGSRGWAPWGGVAFSAAGLAALYFVMPDALLGGG